MAKLNKNIRRSSKYAVGGISVVLAFDTFLASGLNALTIVRDATTVTSTFLGVINNLTIFAGHPVVRLEFEENEALFSDNTVIGANKFPKHSLGLKFSGRDSVKNEIIQTLDLNRTSFLAKLSNGEVVLLGGVNGLIAEKSDSGAGAKNEDFTGYDILLSGAELEKAPLVPAAEFAEFAALVAA